MRSLLRMCSARAMLDATLNLGLGSLVLVMSLTGPWRKDSWWPALA